MSGVRDTMFTRPLPDLDFLSPPALHSSQIRRAPTRGLAQVGSLVYTLDLISSSSTLHLLGIARLSTSATALQSNNPSGINIHWHGSNGRPVSDLQLRRYLTAAHDRLKATRHVYGSSRQTTQCTTSDR